jgi:hypothetical protein
MQKQGARSMDDLLPRQVRAENDAHGAPSGCVEKVILTDFGEEQDPSLQRSYLLI